jgi:hypothetical protein
MSTTVTGSPPRGQTASHRRGSGAPGGPRTRRRFRLPRASTAPGKLRLVRVDPAAGQYEVLGRLAHGGLGWIEFVDMANAIRPRTLT